jgi:four helix bundle protein
MCQVEQEGLVQDYHQLEVWNRAMDYVVNIYEFIPRLPVEERFNLADQLRRAAVSVPLNIAEGAGSAGNAEFGRFLSYAYRSLKETITALELCQRLYSYLPSPSELIDEGNRISRMTYNLIQKVSPDTGLRWE